MNELVIIREGQRLTSVHGWNELIEFKDIQERYRDQYCGSPEEIIGKLLK